jgi:NADH dehydrogenase
MIDSIVTVFGGTGFLGSRIVRHLLDRNVTVRVASRHPSRTRELFGVQPTVQPIAADIHDERSIVDAMSGAKGVVNAVSLYVEHGSATFRSVHVNAARRIASLAHQRGVERFVHVSGIGADPASASPYISSRGQGELAVRSVFPDAIVIRPAVMFGPGDAFLTQILILLRRLPAYPLFGQGRTRLQPAYVEDVAEAVATALQRLDLGGMTFECAGPHVYSYRELLTTIADAAGLRRIFFPVPFALWHVLARLAERLPRPPLARGQVELMENDSVTQDDQATFDALAISPRSLEEILPSMLPKAFER